MNSINCLIIDDEELARVLLTKYVARLPFLNLIGTCKNPIEAMTIMASTDVDLLLLDVQMPGLTGIQFLKSMNAQPQVILTTAYKNYAIEGFELNVADYLLKPFSFERFLKAVLKVKDTIQLRNSSTKSSNTALSSNDEDSNKYLKVHADYKIHRIALDDILYIQSMREYVAFHTVNAKRILSLNSLKKLEQELSQTQFIRVHKSYIVATDKVKSLERNQLLIGDIKIPIGSSYKSQVMEKLFS